MQEEDYSVQPGVEFQLVSICQSAWFVVAWIDLR